MKNSKNKTLIHSTVFATITIATIVGAAVEGIIGFLAVYFFAPIWEKIMTKIKKGQNDKNSN